MAEAVHTTICGSLRRAPRDDRELRLCGAHGQRPRIDGCGWRFHGLGLQQVTGRNNYRAVGEGLINTGVPGRVPNGEADRLALYERALKVLAVHLGAGKMAHLAVALDLYARRIVGWALSNKPDAELVIKALDMAYQQRGRPQGGLFHSDQGSPYGSRQFRQRLWGVMHAPEHEPSWKLLG